MPLVRVQTLRKPHGVKMGSLSNYKQEHHGNPVTRTPDHMERQRALLIEEMTQPGMMIQVLKPIQQ